MSKKEWTQKQDALIQRYRDVSGEWQVGREILAELNEAFTELAYQCKLCGWTFNICGAEDKITVSIPVDGENIIAVSGEVMTEVILECLCQAFETMKKLKENETDNTKG